MAKAHNPEPEADENDDSFLDYIERLGPKCQSIREMVKAEIAEALKGPSASPSEPQSGSYLEKQNAMLLAELMKLKGLAPSIPGEPGQTSEKPPREPELPPSEPKEPVRPKAFWK
jgi:hypothetical protein